MLKSPHHSCWTDQHWRQHDSNNQKAEVAARTAKVTFIADIQHDECNTKMPSFCCCLSAKLGLICKTTCQSPSLVPPSPSSWLTHIGVKFPGGGDQNLDPKWDIVLSIDKICQSWGLAHHLVVLQSNIANKEVILGDRGQELVLVLSTPLAHH